MADTPTAKPRRVWRVIFALSLALNVAVVGVVVGLGAREKGKGVSPRGFDVALGPIGRALEQEDRRAIGDALRNNPALRKDGRAQSREAVEELITVLRATPFETEALETVFMSTNARADQVRNAARAALIAQIDDMTDAQRAALADRLEDGGRRKDR